MDNRQFYIKEFDNNYYYNFKAEYRFFKFIEMFVRTRIFDMKIFKRDMEDIINTIDTSNLPGYKRLLTEEYWKISDDEFPKVINDVLDTVKNGKMQLIDIVKMYAYFMYFLNKDLIIYDEETLKSTFINGMNIASITSDYCENPEEELNAIYVEDNSFDKKPYLHFLLRNRPYLPLRRRLLSNRKSAFRQCLRERLQEQSKRYKLHKE